MIRTLLKKLILPINKYLDNQSSTRGIHIGKNSILLTPRQINGQSFITIGANTTIKAEAWISAYSMYGGKTYNPSIVIGNNVYIGGRACITCIDNVCIQDGCLISEDVYISDHLHGINPEKGLPIHQELVSKGQVVIGENTFIGFRVSILPGVRLGKNCVVGAHSVVTHSFPDYSMIVGAPSRIIKTYSFTSHEWIDV